MLPTRAWPPSSLDLATPMPALALSTLNITACASCTKALYSARRAQRPCITLSTPPWRACAALLA
eukprot:12989749-Alexandrium_andersonii.AAC.1